VQLAGQIAAGGFVGGHQLRGQRRDPCSGCVAFGESVNHRIGSGAAGRERLRLERGVSAGGRIEQRIHDSPCCQKAVQTPAG
jgi:hypothetical protein